MHSVTVVGKDVLWIGEIIQEERKIFDCPWQADHDLPCRSTSINNKKEKMRLSYLDNKEVKILQKMDLVEQQQPKLVVDKHINRLMTN